MATTNVNIISSNSIVSAAAEDNINNSEAESASVLEKKVESIAKNVSPPPPPPPQGVRNGPEPQNSVNSSKAGYTAKLRDDGIVPEALKKCPRLFFRDVIEVGRNFKGVNKEFSDEIGDLSKQDESLSDESLRPENKLISYLAAHKDCAFRSREVMGGYIGFTKPEIDRNLEAACWNLAVAGCCGTNGPDQMVNFIDPRKFYAMFTSVLFDTTEYDVATYGPPITSFDDLANQDGIRRQLSGVADEDLAKFALYKTQIEAIWQKLSNGNPDFESLGKAVMALYLQTNGFEVLNENQSDETPYAIAMYTDDRIGINWRHWGIEVSTNAKTHVFETLPFCSLGHRAESFKSGYAKADNFVFSIPVKELNKQQKMRIHEILNHGLNEN